MPGFTVADVMGRRSGDVTTAAAHRLSTACGRDSAQRKLPNVDTVRFQKGLLSGQPQGYNGNSNGGKLLYDGSSVAVGCAYNVMPKRRASMGGGM